MLNSFIELVMAMKMQTKIKLWTVENKVFWIIPNKIVWEGGKDCWIVSGMQLEQSPCGPMNNVGIIDICVKAI